MSAIHSTSGSTCVQYSTPTQAADPVADARLLRDDCATRLQDVLDRLAEDLPADVLDRIEAELQVIGDHLGMPPMARARHLEAPQPGVAGSESDLLGGSGSGSVVNAQVTDSIT